MIESGKKTSFLAELNSTTTLCDWEFKTGASWLELVGIEGSVSSNLPALVAPLPAIRAGLPARVNGVPVEANGASGDEYRDVEAEIVHPHVEVEDDDSWGRCSSRARPRTEDIKVRVNVAFEDLLERPKRQRAIKHNRHEALPPPPKIPLIHDFSLREYQQAAVDQIEGLLEDRVPTLYQLPTGGGKTVVLGAVMKNAAARGERVLVLVWREEILRQFYQLFSGLIGEDKVSVVAGKLPALWKPEAPVTVAMQQTLVKRLARGHETADIKPDLIMVDEAHHSVANSWIQMIRDFVEVDGARLLGVTATPARTDARPLGYLYDQLVLGPTVSELQRLGHLAPVEVFTGVRIGAFADMDNVRTRGGDYQQSDLDKLVSSEATQSTVRDTVNAYINTPANGKQAIVFTVNVRQSELVAAAVEQRGIVAAHLDGEAPYDHRRSIIERFRAGEIQVLTNCALFGEGFDVPSCEVVILARPTQSLVVFKQQVGRCMRPFENKLAYVIDAAGVTDTLGHPCADVMWSLTQEALTKAYNRHESTAPDGTLRDNQATPEELELALAAEERIESWRRLTFEDIIQKTREEIVAIGTKEREFREAQARAEEARQAAALKEYQAAAQARAEEEQAEADAVKRREFEREKQALESGDSYRLKICLQKLQEQFGGKRRSEVDFVSLVENRITGLRGNPNNSNKIRHASTLFLTVLAMGDRAALELIRTRQGYAAGWVDVKVAEFREYQGLKKSGQENSYFEFLKRRSREYFASLEQKK